MAADRTLPDATDTVVVGGGTAGNVVAARLAEAGVEVLVLEAGPDFGPFGDPSWPDDLLDATRLGRSHDWGYHSGDQYPQRLTFERARAIGGCSDVNGTTQTWGHRADYDAWAAAGNPGWSADELRPLFAEGMRKLRTRLYRADELTPWQRAWYDAGPAVGLPQLDDLNDLDETVGIAPEAVNVTEGVRFNTAFAYLDPVRALANLTIVGHALVDRVLVRDGRAVGVEVVHGGHTQRVDAERVVVAGGAYNSPTVLQRSGIGDAPALRALDIPVVQHLPGVGRNLHDQPFALMSWAGSPRMDDAMARSRQAGWTPDEQAMAKAASSFDPDVFDIHLLPYSPTHRGTGRRWSAGVGCLLPLSRGHVTITGRDPEAAPVIDHGFLSDPWGHDVRVLAEGMQLLRRMAATPGTAELVGAELTPGPQVDGVDALAAWVSVRPDNYWHPVGTCAMGPPSDARAVVDHRGQVYGVEGCHVADCALMPVVPRATTAMPAVVVGERIAAFLLQRAPAARSMGPLVEGRSDGRRS